MLKPEIIRMVYKQMFISLEGDLRQQSSVRIYFGFAVARAEGRGQRR